MGLNIETPLSKIYRKAIELLKSDPDLASEDITWLEFAGDAEDFTPPNQSGTWIRLTCSAGYSVRSGHSDWSVTDTVEVPLRITVETAQYTADFNEALALWYCIYRSMCKIGVEDEFDDIRVDGSVDIYPPMVTLANIAIDPTQNHIIGKGAIDIRVDLLFE